MTHSTTYCSRKMRPLLAAWSLFWHAHCKLNSYLQMLIFLSSLSGQHKRNCTRFGHSAIRVYDPADNIDYFSTTESLVSISPISIWILHAAGICISWCLRLPIGQRLLRKWKQNCTWVGSGFSQSQNSVCLITWPTMRYQKINIISMIISMTTVPRVRAMF